MRLLPTLALLIAAALPATARAQDPPAAPPIDSVTAEGNSRVSTAQVVSTSGISAGQVISYRDIQRAVESLFRTGQFDDIRVEQRYLDGRNIVVFVVTERPVLRSWAVQGVERVPLGDVRGRVELLEGRPIDRAAVARSRGAIDSLYDDRGFYAALVGARVEPADSAGVRVVFDVAEGNRVAVSQVIIDGNTAVPDEDIVGAMGSKPEGFWWFRTGEFDDDRLDDDLRSRIPDYYASRGYLDFRVVDDTLITSDTATKAVLRLEVEEGPQYRVGEFQVRGNRRFSSDELRTFYPFSTDPDDPAPVFDRGAWEAAQSRVSQLYSNNGYIYSRVVPEATRRTLPDGSRVVDLSWSIVEGRVATINRVDIVGNDVTHERVIREAIVMFPGQVFNSDALVRSYQNIANIGFFEQPMPEPSVEPVPCPAGTAQQDCPPDVNITFRVEERRTGNINFGASLGQGTGLGGFLGLEEPNLFGRGKRGRLQWQFGANINDFVLSYTDPAIRESRISGTLSLFDSRQRFIIRDLGRRRQTGGSLQLGFPFLGARYTRLFASYGLQRIRYSEGSEELQERFICNNCTRSTLGTSVVRDTRVGLPFATAGSQLQASGELNGGFLGGSGNYRKVDVEGRWYAPLGTLGGGGQIGAGVQFVLGVTAKSGFIFGNADNFPFEQYSLGGVQFGVPLRGYEEFAITPDGFDAGAGGSQASADAFGKSFAAFTIETGARLNQSFYVSAFLDAGNVYRTARQWDPSRLYRGAGFGVALISPLGPIGVDLAYGFDKVDAAGRPAPGWMFHIKVGNLF